MHYNLKNWKKLQWRENSQGYSEKDDWTDKKYFRKKEWKIGKKAGIALLLIKTNKKKECKSSIKGEW